MYRLLAALVWVISSIICAETFGNTPCRSIYVAIWDDGNPPPETYLFSSEIYSILRPAHITLGYMQSSPDGGVTIEPQNPTGGASAGPRGQVGGISVKTSQTPIPSDPNMWNPTTPSTKNALPLLTSAIPSLVTGVSMVSKNTIQQSFSMALRSTGSASSTPSVNPSPTRIILNPTTSVILPTATLVLTYGTTDGTFIEQGCYQDSSHDGYPLVNPFNAGSIGDVTACLDICSSNSYDYAGVEGGTCWCANAIDVAAPITDGSCNTPCPNDPSQYCAGKRKRGPVPGGHIIIYRLIPASKSSSKRTEIVPPGTTYQQQLGGFTTLVKEYLSSNQASNKAYQLPITSAIPDSYPLSSSHVSSLAQHVVETSAFLVQDPFPSPTPSTVQQIMGTPAASIKDLLPSIPVSTITQAGTSAIPVQNPFPSIPVSSTEYRLPWSSAISMQDSSPNPSSSTVQRFPTSSVQPLLGSFPSNTPYFAIPSSTSIGASFTQASTLPSSLVGLVTSPDGSCGASTGYTCLGLIAAKCCSQYGFCGSEPDYCDAGCQPGYGVCSVEESSTVAEQVSTFQPRISYSALDLSIYQSIPQMLPPLATSSVFDQVFPTPTSIYLSSRAAFVSMAAIPTSGSTSGAPVIRALFSSVVTLSVFARQLDSTSVLYEASSSGSNLTSSLAPSIAQASSTPSSSGSNLTSPLAPSIAQASSTPTPVPLTSSTNGLCGNGITCLGWPLGECCSQYGNCGSSEPWCGLGCQPEFGICTKDTTASSEPKFQGAVSASSLSIPPSPSTTSIPPLVFPNCGPTLTIPGGSFLENIPEITASEIYFGSGFTESPSNPGNPGNDPKYPLTAEAFSLDLQTSLANACLVVELCILFGAQNSLTSIDVHVVEVEGDTLFWECSGYPGRIGTGEYFIVRNTSILAAYGYDLSLAAVPTSSQVPKVQATLSLPAGSLSPKSPVKPTIGSDHPIMSSSVKILSGSLYPTTSITPMPENSMPTSINAMPTSSPLTPTKDGHCGNGITCLGWPLGHCCSQYSSCGSTGDYCGVGCQSKFGLCDSASSVAVPPAAITLLKAIATSSPLAPTDNGYCGNGITCLGWPLGQCCSQYSSCGSTKDYCGAGCQAAFGLCDLPSSAALPPLPMTPTSMPLASAPAIPQAILLATFYSDSDFGGQQLEAYGNFGLCQNTPDRFADVASSMTFSSAGSCTLFDKPECSGHSITYTNGDRQESFLSAFNDRMLSFKCEAPPSPSQTVSSIVGTVLPSSTPHASLVPTPVSGLIAILLGELRPFVVVNTDTVD